VLYIRTCIHNKTAVVFYIESDILVVFPTSLYKFFTSASIKLRAKHCMLTGYLFAAPELEEVANTG